MATNTGTTTRTLVFLLAIVFAAAGVMMSCKEATPAGDIKSPTVSVTSTTSDTTATSPIDVSIVFSEVVTGFDETDLVIANATISVGSFTTTDNRTFTVDLVPDAFELTVTLDIPAGACTDAAGNDNTALASTFARFYTDAPSPTISTGVADPTNLSPIPITITFTNAVENFDETDFTLTNCAVSVPSSGDGGLTWSADLTPSAHGAVEATVPAGVCDQVGASTVANIASLPFTMMYDILAPTVAVTSTTPDPTNTDPISITITFNEDVTGFDSTDLTVGNGSAAAVAGGPSVYTCDITPTAQGPVTVDVAAAVCTDTAGNDNDATSSTFTILYDSDPTVLGITSTTQLRTGANPISITITFNEDVTGFVSTDLTVGNGSAGGFAGSGSVYTCDITPTAAGPVTVDIAAGACDDVDWAANPNVAATQFTRTYLVAPGVGTSVRARNTTTNSVAVSTTVAAGNANNVLIAEVSVESTSTVPVITGVTYGGTALTLVPGSEYTYTNGSNQHMKIASYYLKNPTEGTANVTATFDASYAFAQIGAVPMYDAYVHDGYNPIGAAAAGDGGATTFVITNITTTTARSMLVDMVAGNSDSGTGQSLTPATLQTRLGLQRSTDGCSAWSTKSMVTAGATTMRWDLDTGMTWCLLNSVAEIMVAQ